MGTLPAIAAVVALAATFAPAGRPAGPDLPGPGGSASPAAGAVFAPLDEALGGDRSLLSFLPADVTSGRFKAVEYRDRFAPRPAPRGRGVFWRTPGGNAYSRLDGYDRRLVAGAVAEVGTRVRAEMGEGPAWPFPLRSAAPLYDGDEFQYTLEGLLGIGALAPSGIGAYDEPACVRAVAEHDAAVRRAVQGLTPRFVPAGRVDRWSFRLAPLHHATRPTARAAERACRPPDRPGLDCVFSLSHETAEAYCQRLLVVAIERSPRGITVLSGERGEGLRPFFALEVAAGQVPPPPVSPRPADAFDRLNDFLIRIDACGGLPWGSVGRGDSYYSPKSELYYGPGPHVTRWVCRRDVPPDAHVDPI